MHPGECKLRHRRIIVSTVVTLLLTTTSVTGVAVARTPAAVSTSPAIVESPVDGFGDSGQDIENQTRQALVRGQSGGEPTGATDPGSPTESLHPGTAASIAALDRALRNGTFDELRSKVAGAGGATTDNHGSDHDGQGHGGGHTSTETVENVELDAPRSDSVCPADAPRREFTVHAIQVDIVYNAYGQHDPNGAIYVLASHRQTVLRQVRSAPNATIEILRCLAVRRRIHQRLVPRYLWFSARA